MQQYANGQGFRTIEPSMVGQVTAWPCLLAVGATWDPSLTEEFGAALADEFRSKGANVILGPSLNVHRVARGGRNAEYLSGEDAALGAPLVGAYIRGVQRAGVTAVTAAVTGAGPPCCRETRAVVQRNLPARCVRAAKRSRRSAA